MGVTYSTGSASTYIPIANFTVSTAQASYTFSSISGAYTDLVLIMAGKTAVAGASDTYLMQFNSDTSPSGTNYSRTRLLGTGSAASSAGRTSAPNIDFEGLAGSTGSTTFFTAIANLENYSNTTTYKTCLIRGSDASNYVEATVGLWRSTAAISSIVLSTGSTANFSVGSTFTLYGIKAAG